MSEEFKITMMFVSGLLLLFTGMFITAKGIERTSCHQVAHKMKYKSEWGLFTGCMVEISPNVWRPLNRYRNVEDFK